MPIIFKISLKLASYELLLVLNCFVNMGPDVANKLQLSVSQLWPSRSTSLRRSALTLI